ncbi:MAG TPA: endonuclease/exonuclease/phosphatase family protein [Candidatus Saccharimonadales bacterium]|nr:endonuclease/exonuclease/phosphatase family protein [Candidatus Saccharimonadales bacterium]
MSGYHEANTINLLTLNVQSGGYNSYVPEHELHVPAPPRPEREQAIQTLVGEQQQQHAVDTAVFPDAYLWGETYGSEQGIANFFGFNRAAYTRLGDERLAGLGRAGVGIAIATNQPVAQVKELDLGKRKGLSVILDVGDGVEIAGAYLDDMDEHERVLQAMALVAGLEKDVRKTIIAGDMNGLRADMSGASLGVRVRDMGVRALAKALPMAAKLPLPKGKAETVAALADSVYGMTHSRRVIKYITREGFIDADAGQKRPTAKSSLPIFGIDYIFHTKDVRADRVEIVDGRGVSDHNGLRARLTV